MKTTTWLCGPPSTSGQYQQYPSRFLTTLKKQYPSILGSNTLHMFSGSGHDFGITTDIRPETGADYVCPFDQIPLDDGSVDHVIADPPYADHWQNQWGGELPKPKQILKEATRLVKVDGYIMILHIIVIPCYTDFGISREAIHPILCGTNNVIRCLNVFRRIV